jgi:predicted nucleotidyltransferase
MVQDVSAQIHIPKEKVETFCRKWGLRRLELFGSVLRADFSPESSDVDVMVTLSPDRNYSLIDILRMEDDLAAIFGRKVELTERSTVEKSDNYIRRRHILAGAQPVYEG